MLRPFAWNRNNVGTCWLLLRIVWNRSNFLAHVNGRNTVGQNPQQHATMLWLIASVCMSVFKPKGLSFDISRAFTAPNSIPFGAVSGTVIARLRFRHCSQLMILRLNSVMSVALARCLNWIVLLPFRTLRFTAPSSGTVLNQCANLDIELSTCFHRAKLKYLSSEWWKHDV